MTEQSHTVPLRPPGAPEEGAPGAARMARRGGVGRSRCRSGAGTASGVGNQRVRRLPAQSGWPPAQVRDRARVREPGDGAAGGRCARGVRRAAGRALGLQAASDACTRVLRQDRSMAAWAARDCLVLLDDVLRTMGGTWADAVDTMLASAGLRHGPRTRSRSGGGVVTQGACRGAAAGRPGARDVPGVRAHRRQAARRPGLLPAPVRCPQHGRRADGARHRGVGRRGDRQAAAVGLPGRDAVDGAGVRFGAGHVHARLVPEPVPDGRDRPRRGGLPAVLGRRRLDGQDPAAHQHGWVERAKSMYEAPPN